MATAAPSPRALTARVLAEVSRRDDDANAAINPTLVWNGAHFGVAWVGIHDDRFELWFARLGADGRRVGAPVRVTTSPTAKVIPSLAALGDGWGLAWTDLGEDDIAGYFVRLSAEGRPVGQPEPVARDGVNLAPRVVSNGREYALAWYNVSVTSQMSLHFGRIDANGRRVGGTSVAARGFLATGLADLAWQGDAYGLAWSTRLRAGARPHRPHAPGAGRQALLRRRRPRDAFAPTTRSSTEQLRRRRARFSQSLVPVGTYDDVDRIAGRSRRTCSSPARRTSTSRAPTAARPAAPTGRTRPRRPRRGGVPHREPLRHPPRVQPHHGRGAQRRRGERIDRPWYEREFMRVDWSQNLVDNPDWSGLFYGSLFGDLSFQPVRYYEQNPRRPTRPTSAR
jgi:hypothetical protein